MPLGILSYTMYNQLYLFAPEIDGLWAFTEVPGTINAQGEMDNGVIATGTGAILLRSAADKDAAWEFLKWWTSTETQTAYGIEMEKVMGPAGRQSSANLDVIRAYPWTAQESEVIERQWDTLRAIRRFPAVTIRKGLLILLSTACIRWVRIRPVCWRKTSGSSMTRSTGKWRSFSRRATFRKGMMNK